MQSDSKMGTEDEHSGNNCQFTTFENVQLWHSHTRTQTSGTHGLNQS